MEIVINKTRKIKEIIGNVLAEKGFKYIRCERRLPWMSSFGNDAVEKIYGMDAVKDILSFYFGFLLAGVVMWIFWLIFTIGFTSYAMACTHYRKPQLYTDEGGFLHMVGEEDEQS